MRLFVSICLLLLLAPNTPSEAVSEISKVPKILNQIDTVNHPEGTNAIFTCSIGSGELEGLKYEWFKDDKRLQTSGKLRISVLPENDQSILRVGELNSNDSGVYTCVAKNGFGKDKISTRLNVKVQLKWLTEPSDHLQVPVGRSLQVPCKASGQPEPKVEWRKLNGSRAGESWATEELQYVSINQQDAGYYECRASNGLEKDLVARVKLDVLGEYR